MTQPNDRAMPYGTSFAWGLCCTHTPAHPSTHWQPPRHLRAPGQSGCAVTGAAVPSEHHSGGQSDTGGGRVRHGAVHTYAVGFLRVCLLPLRWVFLEKPAVPRSVAL